MSFKVITIASDPEFPGLQKLKGSLERFGYPYDVLIEPFQFGRQMKTIYKWCKANWGKFLYTDAYDTVALGSIDEFNTKLYTGMFDKQETKMIVSAEKGCYPEERLRPLYPDCPHEWRFVNAGGFFSNCEYFCKIYEDGSHHEESNDQTWLSEQFLKRKEIVLDYDCAIFQTIAFEGANDFIYADGRIQNNFTKQKGIFIHGNGHTDMSRIYSLL